MERKKIRQFEVWWVRFYPSVGKEINKRRPAIVLSNNSLNRNLQTFIAAPLTSVHRNFPSRITTNFNNNGGQIALDQLKCLDIERFEEKIGDLDNAEREDILNLLAFIFEPTRKSL